MNPRPRLMFDYLCRMLFAYASALCFTFLLLFWLYRVPGSKAACLLVNLSMGAFHFLRGLSWDIAAFSFYVLIFLVLHLTGVLLFRKAGWCYAFLTLSFLWWLTAYVVLAG